ncbi:MAG: 50S ribosomal protein L9 [Micavibrio sp.]|nr:50S ribosomal protein L9 [Micavibrio sp.]
MATQVILLERVEKLGQLGDVVSVKPGYARNFLLPQKKAIRASKQNVAYFENQKKNLAAENDKRKKEAEKLATKLKGTKVALIRAASESGQLYGSVSSRDIADATATTSGESITRQMVEVNQAYKMIGLFPVTIALHPEVKVDVIVNIARTKEEAQIQADTGRALVADAQAEHQAEQEAEQEAAALKDVLEDSAFEAEQERKAEEEAGEAEAKAKADEKAAKKAAKAVDSEEETAEESEEGETA